MKTLYFSKFIDITLAFKVSETQVKVPFIMTKYSLFLEANFSFYIYFLIACIGSDIKLFALPIPHICA